MPVLPKGPRPFCVPVLRFGHVHHGISSTMASLLCSYSSCSGECRQICTSQDPSGTCFDHLCSALIRLALGFTPTVAFGTRAVANCLKACNVIKCRYTPKSNTVHFRLGCWGRVFSKVSEECWSPISSLTFSNHASLWDVTTFLLLLQFFV